VANQQVEIAMQKHIGWVTGLLGLAMLALAAAPATAQRGGKINCDVNPGNVDCVGRTEPAAAKPAPAGNQTPQPPQPAPSKDK
jgi:hypothetical protein